MVAQSKATLNKNLFFLSLFVYTEENMSDACKLSNGSAIQGSD